MTRRKFWNNERRLRYGGAALAIAGMFAAKNYIDEVRAQTFQELPTVERLYDSHVPKESPEERSYKLKTFPGFEDSKFSNHDRKITEETKKWNKQYRDTAGFQKLDPNLVKAITLRESGGHSNSWENDPMQISNEGDYALKVLRDSLEESIPDEGYQELEGIRETPRVMNNWSYESVPEENRINSDLSIEYGIRWLFQKALVHDYVEEGPVREYRIREGDNLKKIADKCGTTVESIKEHSELQNPNLIFPGQKINFRRFSSNPEITDFRSWEKALKRYNGRQSYADAVLRLYRQGL